MEKNSKDNEENYIVYLYIGNTRRNIREIDRMFFYLIVNLIDLELPFLIKKIITCLNILLRFSSSDFYDFFDRMIVYIVIVFYDK